MTKSRGWSGAFSGWPSSMRWVDSRRAPTRFSSGPAPNNSGSHRRDDPPHSRLLPIGSPARTLRTPLAKK